MDTPQSIKTYHHVVQSDRSSSFDLKQTGGIYDLAKGNPDSPHRHDYYTVLMAEVSRGVHMVDFTEYAMGDRQVWFVAPGQVHQVKETMRPTGYVMTFTPAFLALYGIEQQFIDDINLFRAFGEAPPIELDDKAFRSLKLLVLDMQDRLAQPNKHTYHAIAALLKLFLIECNLACDIPDEQLVQTMHSGTHLFTQFKQLVEKEFTREHSVKYYARELAVSPDHINKIVKSLTGNSAKEVITGRIILAAKRMLWFSNLSAKQVAFELGFDEAPHFSQFFKRNTGVSPIEFRNSQNGFL